MFTYRPMNNNNNKEVLVCHSGHVVTVNFKMIYGQSCCMPLTMVSASQGIELENMFSSSMVRDREKEIETGDGQVNRTRVRGSMWRLFRENTKTFLNGIFHHITFGMILDSVDQMLAGMRPCSSVLERLCGNGHNACIIYSQMQAHFYRNE